MCFLLFELDNLISDFMLNSEAVKIKTFHYQSGPEILITSGNRNSLILPRELSHISVALETT